MDQIDHQIIALLRENARRSFQDIGSRVSLSAPAVKRRVDKLERDGVIKGYAATVDPAALGWNTMAIVELFCEGRMPASQVKANLERRIHSMNMQDKIFRVLVPMEDEVEFKDGKRKITPKKVFPGYVLVEMDMDDASWYVVRNTSGVTGFVGSPGSGEKPVPLQDKEVKTILKQMGIETPKLKIDFAKGDRVKVTSGPFFDFTGIVDEIQPEKEKVRALISIFGRETPVELEFFQVEKV